MDSLSKLIWQRSLGLVENGFFYSEVASLHFQADLTKLTVD